MHGRMSFSFFPPNVQTVQAVQRESKPNSEEVLIKEHRSKISQYDNQILVKQLQFGTNHQRVAAMALTTDEYGNLPPLAQIIAAYMQPDQSPEVVELQRLKQVSELEVRRLEALQNARLSRDIDEPPLSLRMRM